jgi:hypothetical protein
MPMATASTTHLQQQAADRLPEILAGLAARRTEATRDAGDAMSHPRALSWCWHPSRPTCAPRWRSIMTLVEKERRAGRRAHRHHVTGMAGADADADGPPAGRLAADRLARRRAGQDRPRRCRAAHGIAVCHTPDELTEDVADFAVGLMYAAARRIVEADRFVRAGRWSQERMGLGIRPCTARPWASSAWARSAGPSPAARLG